MTRHQNNTTHQSWGRYPTASNQTAILIDNRSEALPESHSSEGNVLAYGMGRSYGDSCLNAYGSLLLTRSLDHIISFDPETGILRAESGITLAEIIDFALPRGFFLPVTPGTKFVTLGGAIANDIHGKNHHVDGNISHHLTKFELLRSTGQRIECAPTTNSGMFHATIGGIGLTGLITWAEIRLRRIYNPFINQEVIKTQGLADFFELSNDPEKRWTYTVSWIDCLAKGTDLGRGLYIRGNHAGPDNSDTPIKAPSPKLSVPFDFPAFALSKSTVRAFNLLYRNKQLGRYRRTLVHYDPFFYPLDSILHWNRIYGRRGFLQWQCVVPFNDGRESITEILTEISRAGLGSFLTVLKTFGDIPSLGIMSFPRPGVTLALDFPNNGDALFQLLDRLDDITRSARGRIYIAKDARMSPRNFVAFYPELDKFQEYIDPAFSSSFWRRVTRKNGNQ